MTVLAMESSAATPPEPSESKSSDPKERRLAALLERIARSDAEALRALYDEVAPLVHGISMRVLRDGSLAEESTVDTFHQVWTQAQRFAQERGSALGWISMLARGRAVDRSRRYQARAGREQDLATAGDLQGDDQVVPASAARTEEAQVVQSAIRSLPAEQKRCVVAAYYDGMSHREMASAFDLPLGTIKSRVRAAMETLRTRLAGTHGATHG